MVFEVADHGQLAAIERGIADAGDALVGFDFKGDEVAAWAADNDACGGDFHGSGLKREQLLDGEVHTVLQDLLVPVHDAVDPCGVVGQGAAPQVFAGQ